MRWQETPFNSEMYYNEIDGLIVGQVHKLGNQNIVWVAKVSQDSVNEKILGQYIAREFAKKAVEHYYEVQSRTLIE